MIQGSQDTVSKDTVCKDTVCKDTVSQLLRAWTEGDEAALEDLTPLVYNELRKIAHGYMRRERTHVLQTTALVHEAYLRLVNLEIGWRDRHHFYALAARLMRRILVDFARRRRAEAHGLGELHLTLEEGRGDEQPSLDLLALDAALDRLLTLDPRKSRILELRFFGGLTIRETGEVMDLSHATIERDFKLAKAWLGRELGQRSTAPA